MPTIHYLFAALALTLAACGSNSDRPPSGGDNDTTGGDSASFHPQTYDDIPLTASTGSCDDLYDRADACLGLVHCDGLLPQGTFVSQCSAQSFSPQDIGGIISQSCVDINLQLCPQQDALRGCCAPYLKCPSGQVCTDVSDQFGDGVGFCTTSASKVPTDNPHCTDSSDCPDGPWACEQFNSDSGVQQRCIEFCDPSAGT